MASIRNNPQFKAMVVEIKADMTKQLPRVGEEEGKDNVVSLPDH